MEYDLHPEFDPGNRAPYSAGQADSPAPGEARVTATGRGLSLQEARPGIADDMIVTHLLREALADEYGMLPPPEAVRATLQRLRFTPVNAGRIKITDPVTKEKKHFYCWSRDKSIVAATTVALRQQIELILGKGYRCSKQGRAGGAS